jgi:hypothetical protein
VEQLELRAPQFAPYEPVPKAVVPQAVLVEALKFFEAEVSSLLGAAHHPELYLRRLKAGGYVVGIELENDRLRQATGATLAEAVEKLKQRLSE